MTHLYEHYQMVRSQTERICAPLKVEDYVVQPIVDVSPPKWHLGHTTWFFENFILAAHYPGYQLYNPSFNFCFNSYYESQGPRVQRALRGNLTRPQIEEVYAYRQYVDQYMQRFFEQGLLTEALTYVLQIGINHEQQHQELLLTDLKYILGNNPLFPAYIEGKSLPEASPAKPANWLAITEGVYEVGHEGEEFCYDNEQGRHKVFLHAFQVQDRLVTNAEYMAFMEDGGYEQFQWWKAEGLDWVRNTGAQAPLYWFHEQGEWWQYTLYGLQKVNPDLPVTHINYYEADAFARWKGLRLPTEFEWEVACRQYAETPSPESNLQEKQNFMPIGEQQGMQFWGDAWEWTDSAYLPYPFYSPPEGALGEYNGKFMINQMVLRGGSCATPDSHIRSTYRNFFHADKQWQFTGIRLAQTL
ncbi:ergothioneine biosynthesis protein EgtB [Algivirga pacifica]|uniref:Ergothioneine biosynthesis protein EgtB n=1 Tax=Algivirga pacifica TaxID=1162670 RepID=A0ABP9D7K6_9BACT